MKKFKYVIILILFLVALGAGIGLKMFFKPHADVSKMDADFKVEAAGLLGEFQLDETVATTKYSEKALEISGKLVAKSKLQNGTDILILENEMEGISCQLDSNWAAANQPTIDALKVDNPVIVRGICKGYLMEIKVSPAVVVSK
jgi:hypothetical protein